ncbi:hypothetical protein ILUMI_02094 [Ignelater luminosus]|uniref:Uncharacterized protein n=1 Tax=Ignelater luminosus TaxID=2038154 RepID=A0A8K0GJK9_IGNLU|nr:hypothetical protein ILUMI_02094 [Ignelater luminosus]
MNIKAGIFSIFGKIASSLLISAILTGFVSTSSASRTCTFKRNTAHCRGENLTQLPLAVLEDEEFKILDLGANNFTDLGNLKFTNLRYKDSITTLLLDHNQIETLAQNDFAFLSNLEILDLSNNYIQKIEDELCVVSSLKELVLSNNPIRSISEDSLQCLKNLLSLTLVNLTITKLPRDIFKGTNLIRIYLNHTEIKNLCEIYFPESLDLTHIKKISASTECHSSDDHESGGKKKIIILSVISTIMGIILLIGFACTAYKKEKVKEFFQTVLYIPRGYVKTDSEIPLR